MRYLKLITLVSFALFVAACGDNTTQKQDEATATATAAEPVVNAPLFDADSAYDHIAKQVAFGPRTPGSQAQVQCAKWMQVKLHEYCDTVYRQDVKVTGGDGKSLPCINLIGVINPGATKRILFLTHWDSRPWADQDVKDKDKPILAADDGGSGVGVLLEMARQIKSRGLSNGIGIDILFTDVEDYGQTAWGEESYCLGTQYWARHPHIPGYAASFGILLDMVGAAGAQFPLEGISTHFAGDVQQKVWRAASEAGYGSYFPYTAAMEITDDHVPINEMTGIKTIDIINLSQDRQKVFPAHWHTHADAMPVIDRATLKAVGQTLLHFIYGLPEVINA